MAGDSAPPTGVGGVPAVDGFEDLRPIGTGGFATVFAATDITLHRRVALKVLAVSHSDLRRFERECRILATLSDVPGVVPVYSATVTTDGRPVIVMKLLDGGSLTSIVRSDGPLSVSDTVRTGDVLCGALAEAHRRGIFHRDIKPDNVLFSTDGFPALGDFGIATLDAVVSSTDTLGSLSPPHSPPERFVDPSAPSTPQGDVYSLASTLYYCLTGTPPFGTASDGGIAGLLRRVADDPVPRPERDDVPEYVIDALSRALSKRPEDRQASIEEFRSELHGGSAASVGPPPVPPEVDVDVTPAPNRRLGPALIALLLVLVAIAASGAVLMFAPGSDQTATTTTARRPADEQSGSTSEVDRAPPETNPPLTASTIPTTTVDLAVAPSSLTTCEFSGSAVLSPGLVPESFGPQVFDLATGSTIACQDQSGGGRNGVFELHIEFADLGYTVGSGAGTCAMVWGDGTRSGCTATVDLLYPEIAVAIEVESGPFSGQRGTAALAGWELVSDDNGRIIGLTFLPTLITWS